MNQKGHEPKRARTKKSTNQKEHEPKITRTQKGMNQKELKPGPGRVKRPHCRTFLERLLVGWTMGWCSLAL